MTLPKIGPAYEPELFEKRWYEFWEINGAFDAADVSKPGQKAFCIAIPPPNVTGVLHTGHALGDTIEDILTRWHRMKGDNALWIPGTDHAGIATQNQVEKAIAKEGTNRHKMGREKFLERTWKWKDDHHSIITSQIRRLGCSLDWKRERFTMDEGCSRAVTEVFVRLHEEGLMYRGERIINWCPRCQTALSDLEVIPTPRNGNLWHIRYAVVEKDGAPARGPDGMPGTLTIATTRPETLLGDTAVAIHPEDERFEWARGKFVKLPLVGRILPIIQDPYVDREFGTGALKVTPAHDFNDNDLGKKHSLPVVSVMGKDGKITAEGGAYAGLKFPEARERVVQDLEAGGLLVKVEPHPHNVGLCERCEQVAEPLLSKQWFVKIAPLAGPAIRAVEEGKIEFAPKNWEKTYFEWMRNIRDWCVSRQLWWGHRIPAWHCGKCEEITVARVAPTECPKCHGRELAQDEDVLDTWFSSALWPFSTLGWPDQTPALKTFYPTSILETGFDIIFFWVARMIMMGLHFMGDVPFRKVYLHALVRDEKGEKMSKSKGNVIDPLVLIDEHGADPLRFTLAIMAGQGRDIKLSGDRVAGYRGFANKLWNAVKFFHLQWEQAGSPALAENLGSTLSARAATLRAENAWILSRLENLIPIVEKGLETFHLNESAQALYDFTWGEYCDWYIEFAKVLAKENAALESLETQAHVLDSVLKLLHPFMPFLTEELWQSLPVSRRFTHRPEVPPTIMLQEYPRPTGQFLAREAEAQVYLVRTLTNALRNFKGENRLSPRAEFKVGVVAGPSAPRTEFEKCAGTVVFLTKVLGFDWSPDARNFPPESIAKIPLPEFDLTLLVNLDGLVDQKAERARIEKEIEKVKSDLAHAEGKLSRESFVSKAPPKLVEEERVRAAECSKKLGELESALSRLKG